MVDRSEGGKADNKGGGPHTDDDVRVELKFRNGILLDLLPLFSQNPTPKQTRTHATHQSIYENGFVVHSLYIFCCLPRVFLLLLLVADRRTPFSQTSLLHSPTTPPPNPPHHHMHHVYTTLSSLRPFTNLLLKKTAPPAYLLIFLSLCF